MSRKVRKHIFLEGRVQGVGFRHFILNHALDKNIYGWVKNHYDGRVEAVFEGWANDVISIINKAKKGPRWAQVDNIKINNEKYKGEFDCFHVRY